MIRILRAPASGGKTVDAWKSICNSVTGAANAKRRAKEVGSMAEMLSQRLDAVIAKLPSNVVDNVNDASIIDAEF
jgi:hypothetical protein